MSISSVTRAFAKWPILVNGCSGSVFALIGDVVCQRTIEGAAILDESRARAMTVFGGIYTGGVCHFIYSSYVHILPAAMRATQSRYAFGSTMLDNFGHVPFM